MSEAKKRRRGHNEGTGYKRADGRAEWKITLPDGRRKSFYGATMREAKEKAWRAQRDLEEGLDLAGASVTVGAFLTRWLDDVAKQRIRPSTYASYESHIRVHLIPTFGRVKLRNLTPQHVNKLMADRVAAGMSPTTANRIRATLRTALSSAVKWRLITQNVAALADARPERKTRIKPIELDDARCFLAATRDDRLGPLFHVALTTGMRQGELLALRWQDVDLDTGILRVHHTLSRSKKTWTIADTKTDQSRRTIKLTTSTTAALRRQMERLETTRQLAGDRWQEHDLVFPSTVGTPLSGTNVTHRFQELIERAGLPRKRFHDFRHTAASLMLAEGLDLFTVKEILGHSQISQTANTYGHLTKKLANEAAERMERALGEDVT